MINTFFSGCTNKDSDNYYSKIYENSSPVLIEAPKEAYFDQIIDFEANCDKYEDKISSYKWDFQDGEKIFGKNVKHKYFFTNDFEIEYPVIYTVTLFTTFKDNSIRATKHCIKLYPKYFTFYLQKDKLSEIKPGYAKERLTKDLFSINNQKELIYTIDHPISVNNCKWDLTLNIKKPLILNIKNINIMFYNKDDIEITEKKIDNIFKIGFENLIKISGNINQDCIIKKIILSFSIFSLRNDIDIIYGGENPSTICFRFN
jgi:hypothetical protein